MSLVTVVVERYDEVAVTLAVVVSVWTESVLEERQHIFKMGEWTTDLVTVCVPFVTVPYDVTAGSWEVCVMSSVLVIVCAGAVLVETDTVVSVVVLNEVVVAVEIATIESECPAAVGWEATHMWRP
jgi:hypothetical protein